MSLCTFMQKLGVCYTTICVFYGENRCISFYIPYMLLENMYNGLPCEKNEAILLFSQNIIKKRL